MTLVRCLGHFSTGCQNVEMKEVHTCTSLCRCGVHFGLCRSCDAENYTFWEDANDQLELLEQDELFEQEAVRTGIKTAYWKKDPRHNNI